MKASVIITAAAAGVATATKGGQGGQGSSSYGSWASNSKNCPFIPSSDQYILFADNIQTVSQANPDTAFLRSQDLYIQTPYDLATASVFTVPDFALGAQCSLNLAVPSSGQVFGDLNQVSFSGGGNLNFSRLVTNLPSSGLTFNTLGTINNNGVSKVTPGKNLVLANFPCPPPGTQLNGIIQSVDTSVTVRDALGPVCLSGLFVVIEPVGNPPVSPPPPSTSAGSSSGYPTGSVYASSGYHTASVYASSGYPTGSVYTSSGWGSSPASASFTTYSSAATYSSVWHS